MAKVDPELERQLSASTDDEAVEAVVHLQSKPGVPAPPPEETERLTRELVNRTQQASGQQEGGVNVFKYLGSFAISAKPAFLKTLLDQPEVKSAVANKQPSYSDSGMIPPVAKRPARIEDVGRDTGKASAPARKRSSSSKRPSKRRSR